MQNKTYDFIVDLGQLLVWQTPLHYMIVVTPQSVLRKEFGIAPSEEKLPGNQQRTSIWTWQTCAMCISGQLDGHLAWRSLGHSNLFPSVLSVPPLIEFRTTLMQSLFVWVMGSVCSLRQLTRLISLSSAVFLVSQDMSWCRLICTNKTRQKTSTSLCRCTQTEHNDTSTNGGNNTEDTSGGYETVSSTKARRDQPHELYLRLANSRDTFRFMFHNFWTRKRTVAQSEQP